MNEEQKFARSVYDVAIDHATKNGLRVGPSVVAYSDLEYFKFAKLIICDVVKCMPRDKADSED